MATSKKLLFVGAGAAAVVLAKRLRRPLPQRPAYRSPTTARFCVDLEKPHQVKQYNEVGDIVEWRTFDGREFDHIHVEEGGLLEGLEKVGDAQDLYPDADNPCVVRARVIARIIPGTAKEIRVLIFLKGHGGDKDKAPPPVAAGIHASPCDGCA